MQRTLVFMLKNVIANCKIYDSQADGTIQTIMNKLNFYRYSAAL